MNILKIISSSLKTFHNAINRNLKKILLWKEIHMEIEFCVGETGLLNKIWLF